MSPTSISQQTITAHFRVDGMHCASCVARIETALRKSPGVDFDPARRRIAFRVWPDHAPPGFAAAAMSASSVLVVTNSLRLRKFAPSE